MSGLPSASLLENARFNALVVVPNAVQGLFKRRAAAVAAATRVNVDGQAVGLLAGMARRHGGGPVWVRLVRERALLLLTPADVHRALAGSPDPFASDPPAKRDGMRAFQPDALTISRGELWRNRRNFTEAVLETGRRHHLSDRFAEVAREEIGTLLVDVEVAGGELEWDAWQEAFRRLTRRVVLGDAARDDDAISRELAEMMSEGNGMPGEPSERYRGFISKVAEYAQRAEPGSLVSLFEGAPHDASTRTTGQAGHWLFATHDTLAINAFRCLALLAAHPRQAAEAEVDRRYLEACLHEAMRLWPTTPMLSRETTADTEWQGATVPAGTQVVIVNTYLHRDTDRYPWADRFAPERWLDGEAAESFSFNHFSRGPQGCPGTGIAIGLGAEALAALLAERTAELRSPRLEASGALPHMLDFFGLRFALAPR